MFTPPRFKAHTMHTHTHRNQAHRMSLLLTLSSLLHHMRAYVPSTLPAAAAAGVGVGVGAAGIRAAGVPPAVSNPQHARAGSAVQHGSNSLNNSRVSSVLTTPPTPHQLVRAAAASDFLAVCAASERHSLFDKKPCTGACLCASSAARPSCCLLICTPLMSRKAISLHNRSLRQCCACG